MFAAGSMNSIWSKGKLRNGDGVHENAQASRHSYYFMDLPPEIGSAYRFIQHEYKLSVRSGKTERRENTPPPTLCKATSQL